MAVEYASVSDKQVRYVQETLPLIFSVAWEAYQGGDVQLMDGNVGRVSSADWTLQEIHEYVRTGRYVREYGPRDEVFPPAHILLNGGDCEDWAAYQLAIAWGRGVPARIVTAGDGRDNFQHTYVEWLDQGEWTATNPKGSQEGMPYRRHSDWRVKRRWQLIDGRVVEISDVEGSGSEPQLNARDYFKLPKKLYPNNSLNLLRATFPPPPYNFDRTPINTWGEFYRLLSESQQRWFWKTWEKGGFGPWQSTGVNRVIEALEDRLDAGQLNMTRGEILHWVHHWASLIPPMTTKNRFRQIVGSNKKFERALRELDPTQLAEEVNTLENVNLAFASRWAAEMLDQGDSQLRDTLIDAAVGMGGNPEASDEDLAAVWAARVTQLATNQLIALDVLHLLAREHPEWDPATLTAAARDASVAGSGSILSEFFEDAGHWLQRVFVTEIGKGIRAFARNILRVEKDAPWAAQFLLRPLGFITQAQVLNQLGEAMVDGSVATFDEKAVATDFAGDLTSWGQALVVASPFLSAVPPPLMWSTLSAAVGALAVAGGGLMQDALNENSALNTGQLGQDQTRTFYVDEFGREIGADGLPVDPYQRQIELQKRAQLQPAPNDQVAGEWRQGSDGLFYGWYQLSDPPTWYWLALQVDQAGTVTAGWAWTPEGWVQL